MRQVEGYGLWIGNPSDIRDVRGVLDAGIEAVVELADNEAFANLPREFVRCRFPLSEGGENADWLLMLAIETISVFLKNQVSVLVCCSGGMNRSVCIAAGGIAMESGVSLIDALKIVVGSGPADVSPRMFERLRTVHEKL